MRLDKPQLTAKMTEYDELPDEDEIIGARLTGLTLDHEDLHGVEFRQCI